MPFVLVIWSFMALGQAATAGQPTAAQVKADALYQNQDWTDLHAALVSPLGHRNGVPCGRADGQPDEHEGTKAGGLGK